MQFRLDLFTKLFINVYEESELTRSQFIKKIYTENIDPTRSLKRDEFIIWVLKYLPENMDTDLVVNFIQPMVSECQEATSFFIKDWIGYIQSLASKKEIKRLAHFHCEMAEILSKKEQWKEAFQHYKQALGVDSSCVRASVGAANVLSSQRRYRDAIKELKQVAEQDPEFISIIIPQLKECYQRVWGGSGFIKFLQEQNQKKPSAALILALAQHYMEDDKEYAEMFLVEQLRLHPTLKGFRELINLQMKDSRGQNQQHLEVLFELVDQLAQVKPQFQCRQCGFSGHQLHWQCPSCKEWGVVAPIQGVEGE